MRTTVDIDPSHVAHVKQVTGKSRLSEAINELIAADVRKRKQLELIDMLTREKTPHDWKKIKAARKRRKWTA